MSSQLSDENVTVHFLPPILELCALQQQLLAGQLNVFVRCEKTYSLKAALNPPIYINNVLYFRVRKKNLDFVKTVLAFAFSQVEHILKLIFSSIHK